MWQSLRKSAGFTLIELLVVVIIVAVLAAGGVPLLSANVTRAQMTEAETGLGTIRTALRAYSVENTAFPANPGTLGLVASDFQGQFFEFDDYNFVAAGSFADYCITATGDTGGPEGGVAAPGGVKVNLKSRSMDENGTIYSNAACTPAA